ncbi:Uncharacterised protein [Providencia rustigianii]|uniref:Uncharacterized protein n=1 Tax=Providencia rustigianii TaxID=158850 RepID=A0A379G5W0_9GAMM|nr:Uncharacterised protein [Providencia rustigianii]
MLVLSSQLYMQWSDQSCKICHYHVGTDMICKANPCIKSLQENI